MNGQQYAERHLSSFSCSQTLFVPECTLSQHHLSLVSDPRSPWWWPCTCFQPIRLSPAAGSQHRREQRNKVAEWAPRDVGGNRLSFLYSNFRSLSHLLAHSRRDSLLLSYWESKLALGQVWPMPAQWAMLVLTGYLLLATAHATQYRNTLSSSFNERFIIKPPTIITDTRWHLKSATLLRNVINIFKKFLENKGLSMCVYIPARIYKSSAQS